MKRIPTLALAALAALAIAPAPAVAQATEAAQADIHTRLYEVIVGGVDIDVATRRITSDTVDQLLASDPLLAEIHGEEPDFRKDMITTFYPHIMSMTERVQAQYRPQFIAMLQERLDTSQAAMMIEVFDSRVGRKLMGGLSRNITSDRTMDEAIDGGDVTRGSIEADNRETAQRTVAQLDAQDMLDLGAFAERYPQLLPTFQSLSPHLLDIRVRMDNELPTPEEDALLIADIEQLYARYGLTLGL